MARQQPIRFPADFLWGAVVSAHQTEGGNHNQWSVWELENARSLAAQASYQYGDLENWHSIERQAKSPDNYVSAKAVDHYHQYQHDFDLVKRMHMNALRFSVEWSRLQPEKDAWNVDEMQHYKEYVAALKQRGLEPIVTLFHITLPVWFVEMGGFEKRRNVRYFVDFAEKVISELGPAIQFVITMHEPDEYVRQSYLIGRWPPQDQSRSRAFRVLNNLALAHNRVAELLHAQSGRYKVSVAKNSAYIYPGDDAWLTVRASAAIQYIHDDYFLQKVMKTCDFIGVNYHGSQRIYGYRVHNDNKEISDLGNDLHPDHLAHALERLSERYKKPILVTESGIADATDRRRKWWLMQSIIAMQQALSSGVELIGYLHGGLLDSFEWDKGFWPRYGLYEVDRKSMKRSARPSAAWLSKVIKSLRGI
jgi:beta-glucosidase